MEANFEIFKLKLISEFFSGADCESISLSLESSPGSMIDASKSFSGTKL